jgi:hypothetical protein
MATQWQDPLGGQGGAQCHQTGADGCQDAHQIRAPAKRNSQVPGGAPEAGGPAALRNQDLLTLFTLQATRVSRGAEEKKTKNGGTYLPTYLFLRFFEIFRSDFRKYFYGVFGLLM